MVKESLLTRVDVSHPLFGWVGSQDAQRCPSGTVSQRAKLRRAWYVNPGRSRSRRDPRLPGPNAAQLSGTKVPTFLATAAGDQNTLACLAGWAGSRLGNSSQTGLSSHLTAISFSNGKSSN